MKKYPTVLSIAGSDCKGEAGVQSDMKTITALNAYATTVITSIAVQNPQGIKSIHVIPSHIVRAQIESIMETMWPDVLKIGLVNDVETAKVIADCVRKYHPKYVVYDPVMVTLDGLNVPDNDTIKVIKDELLHYINLMTINLAEAEVFTGFTIRDRDDVKRAAQKLAEKHRIPVLIKAGNFLDEQTYDILYIPDGEKWEYTAKRINVRSIHNASLIFSAGIATFLAYGNKLHEAVRKGREFVEKVLEWNLNTSANLSFVPPENLNPFILMETYHE